MLDADMYLLLLFKVNPDMVERLEQAGLKFVGRDESGQRMEVSPLHLLSYVRWC